MTSNVVIVDTTARRATIKTTPDKYLVDIHREACQKLGRDSEAYGLKHNGKALDLSRNVRLAGLSPGAKLELVLSSRSPSVVSIALQLSEPDHQGLTRLTDKFPSSTTLWMVLRKFESVEGAKRNFTGRGQPVMSGEGAGAGRLCFETPVIQIMGRELSSFTDLQKNLAQLGFNSGSALLRLTFKTTNIPLEEAMKQISQYFDEVGPKVKGEELASAPAIADSQSQLNQSRRPSEKEDLPCPTNHSSSEPCISQEPSVSAHPSSTPNGSVPVPKSMTDGAAHRPMTVFAPPSNSTPHAAQEEFNEKDFVPTIQHAKLHQSRLQTASINKRLLSDAEIAAKEEAQAQKKVSVKEIEIKVRFQDQMQIVSTFTDTDTADNLHQFVKGLMIRDNEPIMMRFSSATGPKNIPSGRQGHQKLVRDLGMTGRVLVNVLWDEGASFEARDTPVLKESFRKAAQELKVDKIEGTVEEEKPQSAPASFIKEDKGQKKGIPKWLKLPGKK